MFIPAGPVDVPAPVAECLDRVLAAIDALFVKVEDSVMEEKAPHLLLQDHAPPHLLDRGRGLSSGYDTGDEVLRRVSLFGRHDGEGVGGRLREPRSRAPSDVVFVHKKNMNIVELLAPRPAAAVLHAVLHRHRPAAARRLVHRAAHLLQDRDQRAAGSARCA